jgi:hypothetical protein
VGSADAAVAAAAVARNRRRVNDEPDFIAGPLVRPRGIRSSWPVSCGRAYLCELSELCELSLFQRLIPHMSAGLSWCAMRFPRLPRLPPPCLDQASKWSANMAGPPKDCSLDSHNNRSLFNHLTAIYYLPNPAGLLIRALKPAAKLFIILLVLWFANSIPFTRCSRLCVIQRLQLSKLSPRLQSPLVLQDSPYFARHPPWFCKSFTRFS